MSKNKNLKCDEKQDEIIWQLEYKRTFGFFCSWIVRIGYFVLGIYLSNLALQKYLSSNDNGLLISIIIFSIFIVVFGESITNIQNIKSKGNVYKK